MNKQERIQELEKELQRLKEDVADKQLLIDKIKSQEEVDGAFVLSDFNRYMRNEVSAFNISFVGNNAFVEFDFYYDFKSVNDVTKIIREELSKKGYYNIYFKTSLNHKSYSLCSFG